MHRLLMVIGLVGWAGLVVAQGLPAVEGAGSGTSLSDLAGTPTLVTVVIADTGAKVENLVVTEVHDKHFMVRQPDGTVAFYPFGRVDKVIVQEGKVEAKRVDIENKTVL
ncbi:MAG TPA: hypothetical protein ENN80_09825, partial [Candidatus Hydrogenedentes bacterium]|nr:hypothetical protein [Candidatus Hydrogenedentota bacterium]